MEKFLAFSPLLVIGIAITTGAFSFIKLLEIINCSSFGAIHKKDEGHGIKLKEGFQDD